MAVSFINWRTELPAVSFLGAFAGLSAYLSDRLPDIVAVHWNMAGEPDAFGSRTFVVWFFPLMALFVYLLMLVVWHFDPKRDRYVEFARAYHLVKTLLVAFLFGLYGIVAASGLGYDFSVTALVLPLVGLLFVGIGTQLPSVKQNWMFGIRTPWTLSSEKVWNRTHRFASYLFIFGGATAALSSYLPGRAGSILFCAALGAAALLPVLYSYILYQLEQETER